MDSHSLYIHWPFCPYKCHFCPFVAFAKQDHLMERYHAALMNELLMFRQKYDQKLLLNTIYFGGGTPSTYPEHLLLDTFAILKRENIFADDIEITIEVNPGTVTQDKLALWSKIGVTRLSIGVQSLKDSVLQELNRHQSAADVQAVLQMAKGLFKSVSIDLIVGLPGVSQDEWREMIETVVTWPINHISVYYLTVHEDTPLYFRVQQKRVELPCDDMVVDLYQWTCNQLNAYGFEQYELSSFAKKGHESRHNRMYWSRKPFKGVGVGAWSFDGQSRFQNEKNLMLYMQAAEAGNEVIRVCDQLTDQQVHLEKVMLGLRQTRGLLLADMFDGLSVAQKESITSQIAFLQENGFIVERDDRIFMTPRGMSIENTIAQRLSL
ncbi:MAG TPA: radical SAM family heme chaperone HemW [Candidatus Babeliales bacterium]|nr:radical SAM family heme chaperone HemW [Candidatus Babeliales bacterium]